MNFRKRSKQLFFVFLFLFPFQTVYLLRESFVGGEKWQYGTIGLYGADIFLLAAILFTIIAGRFWEKIEDLRSMIFGSEDWISRFFVLKSKILHHKSFAAFALLVLWIGLSALWAPDHVLAGYFFVKLLLAVGAFSLARSLDEKGVGMAVKILFAAAVIQSLLGIGQFVMQNTFASSLLGMSHYEAWQAGTSVLKSDSGRWLRAYGSFPHPNMLGGFLAATFVLGISYLVSGVADKHTAAKNAIPGVVEGSRRKPRRFLDKLGMAIGGSVLIASLLIILLALILTFSRAAWFGVAFGLGAFIALSYLKSRTVLYKRTVLYVTAVAGMATIVFSFILSDQVFPRFDGATIAREGSVSERIISFRDAETLIAEHPIIGVGAGNFTNEVMRLESDRPVWSIQPAHNVFVLVFAELGAVGFLLFVGFFLSVIANAAKQADNKNDDFRFSIYEKASRISLPRSKFFNRKSAILLALLPSLLLDHWLWSSHFGLLFFFLLSGLAGRSED